MFVPESLIQKAESISYKVSTDTRQSVSGTIFFALSGENFDGSSFIDKALADGAVGAVTDNKKLSGENIWVVENVLGTLQALALLYREKFTIPIIAVGGSNGKTTTRELIKTVLQEKYKVHSSSGNLNNHLGLPLSILSMPKEAELGIFEIGANHQNEHLNLLSILKPTHVLVTNNGLDHLEGFGSPEGVRKANREIYDWAFENKAKAFVNKEHIDLVEDSERLDRVIYPENELNVLGGQPLSFELNGKFFETKLIGRFNIENIKSALAVGKEFGISYERGARAVVTYIPNLKRSQLISKNGINFILDSYNANPSSMNLSIESFLASTKGLRGVVLGDMLELGDYSHTEHVRIIKKLSESDLNIIILIGDAFNKALKEAPLECYWFQNSEEAKAWFDTQDFRNFTFLLKGSRGKRVEHIVEG